MAFSTPFHIPFHWLETPLESVLLKLHVHSNSHIPTLGTHLSTLWPYTGNWAKSGGRSFTRLQYRSWCKPPIVHVDTVKAAYVCYQNSQCTQLGLPSSESGCCSSVGTTHFINISAPTECRPCGKCHTLVNWLFLYINTLYSGNIRLSVLQFQICAD